MTLAGRKKRSAQRRCCCYVISDGVSVAERVSLSACAGGMQIRWRLSWCVGHRIDLHESDG